VNDDFKKLMYGVIGGFAALIVVWLLFMFVSSCGFDVSCQKAEMTFEGTPIPTLSAAHISSAPNQTGAGEFSKCQVKALDLLGAWVSADYPETDAFEFTDMNGMLCVGTYEADIAPLLSESQLWFSGSLSCTSCHNDAFKKDMGGLDATTYAGLLAGSQRESAEQAKGVDIFGGGDWESSPFYQSLTLTENVPAGHPTADQSTALIVYAGQPAPPPATPTP
jgi:hypothetical protein